MTQNQETRHGRPAGAGRKPTHTRSYYDKSWAVVIGINDYGGRHNPLRNARNDAEAIVCLLRDYYSFEVIPPLYDVDATRYAIMTYLRDELPNLVRENDRLIFFFAGHGATR